jgi:predicted nuclease of restriction endonuclease-like RecB superfamily
MNTFAGIFFLFFGLILLLFRARLSRRAMEDWARVFPRVKVQKFMYDAFALVGGFAFVITGAAILLGLF